MSNARLEQDSAQEQMLELDAAVITGKWCVKGDGCKQVKGVKSKRRQFKDLRKVGMCALPSVKNSQRRWREYAMEDLRV